MVLELLCALSLSILISREGPLGGSFLNEQIYLEEYLEPFIHHTDPVISTFNAWLLLS